MIRIQVAHAEGQVAPKELQDAGNPKDLSDQGNLSTIPDIQSPQVQVESGVSSSSLLHPALSSILQPAASTGGSYHIV